MPLGEYATTPVVPVLHKAHCCALGEIDYLSLAASPEDAFRALGLSLWSKMGNAANVSFYGFNFIVFSGASNGVYGPRGHGLSPSYDYAQAFADYITTHKLGALVVSEPRINPSTQHTVKVWLWSVDPTALFDHLHAAGIYTPPFATKYMKPKE